MRNGITYLGINEEPEIHKEVNKVKKQNFKSRKYSRKLSKFISKTKKTLINKKVLSFIAIIAILSYIKPIAFLRNKLEEKREFYAQLQDYRTSYSSNSYSIEGIGDYLIYSIGADYYKNCKNTMVYPADGTLTCPYDLSHKGIDIACEEYQGNIYAAANGYVCYIGYNEKYGNEILIEHIINGVKLYTYYANLSIINVTNGQYVYQNQVIAHEGGSPDKKAGILDHEGHHLHFEVRKSIEKNSGLNPLIFIK